MSLPKGFKRLEYIQSSGTQYIDTGFKPNNNTRVVCDTVFTPSATAFWLFGARNGNQDRTFNFLTYDNQYRSDYNTSTDEHLTGTKSERFVLDKDKNITKINGITEKTASSGAFQCTHNLFLFANNNNGTVGGQCTAKLYSCQIYDNGTLVRDYVPCINDSGEVGLYDLVGRQFYGNAGTGTFTAGPVVVVVIPEAPSNLQQTMSVRLIWAEVSGAEQYNVYRDDTLLGTTTGLFYVDDTAAENTEYTYAVSAVNSAGESPKTTISVYTKSGYFLYKPLIQSATFQ